MGPRICDPAYRHQAQELASRYVEPAGASVHGATQGLRYTGSVAVQHRRLAIAAHETWGIALRTMPHRGTDEARWTLGTHIQR